MTLAFIAAVCVVGFQPYITNTIHKGNPFYPSMSVDKEGAVQNVVMWQAPREFMEMNRFGKLFYSLFSKSEHRTDRMPRLKIPISMDGPEIEAFRHPDVRFGGFGPLYGSVLILTVGVAMVLIGSRRLVGILTLVAAGVILLPALVNPEAWWARLSPQLWLLPLAFVVALYYIHHQENRYVQYLRGFAISLLFINCILVANKYISNTLQTGAHLHRQVTQLQKNAEASGRAITVHPGNAYLATQFRLNRLGAKHRMSPAQKKKGKRLTGVYESAVWLE